MSGSTPQPSCYAAVVKNEKTKRRLSLTVSKSLRTIICVTGGMGFGVEAALVSTGVTLVGWLVVDITGLGKPLVALK